MNNQMQLAHNLPRTPPTGGNLCGDAACGARDCVNLANAATVSGDYLFIEGAFSMDAAPAGNTYVE